jgi:autotransporter-associated beta strand protein
VGNAGTSGTLGTGAVVNNATLEFNRSDAFTFAQNISGTGGLSKLLSNTVTLTGATTYAGATAISAGTLVLERNAPSTASSGFSGAGALRIEPAANDFSAGLSLTGWTFDSTLGGLTLGKLSGADGSEQIGTSAEHGDRVARSNRFGIDRQISVHAVPFLCASECHSESRDYFVDDEHDPIASAQRSHLLEVARQWFDQSGVAHDRLHQESCD